jgi:hypothetical protein
MRMATFKNGHATFERLIPSGYYLIRVYIGSELYDKVRCDDYRMALDYWKSFKKLARGA